MIIVIGNSHVQMLRRANPGEIFAIHWLNLGKGVSATHGDITLDEAVTLMGGASLVALSLLGTSHNIYGLLQHDQPFDVMLPDDTPPEGVTIIPYNVLVDMFLTAVLENKPLRRLVGAAKGPVVHIATPPPKGSDEHILEHAGKYRDGIVNAETLNPAARRLRLWNVEMEAMRRACDELGIGYLPPPPEALTDEGFLRAEFYSTDATHANAEYGALVLEQLASICPPTQPTACPDPQQLQSSPAAP